MVKYRILNINVKPALWNLSKWQLEINLEAPLRYNMMKMIIGGSLLITEAILILMVEVVEEVLMMNILSWILMVNLHKTSILIHSGI